MGGGGVARVSAALYSYYGDDFTGSTDVLEALATAGVRSVLFLGAPSEEHRRRFADCQAFGIAGDSRSRSPEWMDEHLPEIFAQLRSFGAPVAHYKTCSTFDSSPHVGSIGRAMEIGRCVLQPDFIPIVVAAPHLRRYVVFGNLFAAAGDQVYRIDRHPTMRRHPVTPMHEADLRQHLALQTQMSVGLIDLPTLQAGGADQALESFVASSTPAVLFDGIGTSDLFETGRILWQRAHRTGMPTSTTPQPLLAVGSSGLTYSLVSAWRAEGSAADAAVPPTAGTGRPAERLLVISGSCSPATERQIKHALQRGYEGVAIDPVDLISDEPSRPPGSAPSRAYVEKAIAGLRANGKVVVYTSLGPLPGGVAARGDTLGRQLGAMLREIIHISGVRRVVLAGGDTSSHAVAQLGLYALTWAATLQPGAPLCRAHSDSPELDELELVLKGGQVGTDDFFERVRTARP
jgi:3-oxoisoapionate kinase